ncbi:nitronate monooxygenase family protein [Pseudomonas sp. NCCP-436]|uniref:NAD(P)H-dependent flavin oxidoreductase n=1 Tax=Pseudomonas sp. NCCP-436 TaxID=2842481 RepID=UPI001C818B51|nr:nitronate monooxygenase [Pseudomonas sp. NCCP-436]GIZ12811.1 2-nitropropane dioxygenase [Pseudomonas sp. NCCP-436]
MSLTALFGCELPLIQAPMAGSQDHRLAASVCVAGALGSIPAAMLSAEALRKELQAMRSLTARPFNLNFFCHSLPQADASRESAWRQLLTPYYAELGLDPTSPPSGPGRLPFNAETAELVEEFRPAVVSFHFGLPEASLLERVRRSGARILSSATTLNEALWLQERGVDAVIAQGLEAGGHRGHFLEHDLSRQLGTFALLPQLVDVLNVPVIAAGGIGDARGVAAAMALGAAGVQVGTAYLLCPEAATGPLHRAALQSPAARHTALTNLFSGRPARGIVNRLMREQGPLQPQAPVFPLATAAIAPLRAAAEARGNSDFSPLWAGQSAPLCRPLPAAELTRELARGFAAGASV